MEERLKEILRIHRGRSRAITAKRIAELVDAEERFVRVKIRSLISEGWPIASVTEKLAGYFLVETIEEANNYAQNLRNRLIEDALRRRDFKRAIAKSFDGGQLKMF